MGWVEEFFTDPIYDQDYAKIIQDSARAEREAEFIVRELSLSPRDRVLDLACGHGRHAIRIAPKVASLVGYDLTQRFIDHARKAAAETGITNVEFIVGDMRELPYQNEFDAVWNYFTAWGYYCEEENFDVLRRVCRALKPGGRFLLEMASRDALMRRHQPKDWRILDDGTVILDERRFDVVTGRAYNRRTFITPSGRRVMEFDHQMPGADELLRMLRRAGFAETRLVAAPDSGPVTIDTFRIAAVGTKER